MHRELAAFVIAVLLGACSRPSMPDKDKPVEPKAAVRQDDLTRAMRAPLQRANATQAAADADRKSQEAAIDAASAP